MSIKLHVLGLLALCIILSHAAFYDCDTELTQLTSDEKSLSKIKQAHDSKLKFSSSCLEILLKKNFFLSSEYLLDNYYKNTSIDTEVIVKNVANDIKRNQD